MADDPRLGRFLSVDPLAEKYPGWSPYNYVFDNPLKFTDPTGMWPWPTQKALKEVWAGMKDGWKDGWWGVAQTAGYITQLGDFHIANNADRVGNHEYAALLRKGADDAAANLTVDIMVAYLTGKVGTGISNDFSKVLNKDLGKIVDDFMTINNDRINDKIGNKIGKTGKLPYKPGPNAINEAKDDIRNTLLNPTKTSDIFKDRGGDKVFDVFSHKTGKTVRLKEDGSFHTLINEATKIIKEIE